MKRVLVRRFSLATSLALVIALPSAGANEPAADAPESKAEYDGDEPTAADVAQAPRPHEDNSGIAGGQEGVPGYLWLPRLALYPVRGALEIAMAPLRGLIYVEQKYAVRDRLKAFFFTEDERYGVYPTALIETGFGLNVGARVVAKQPLHLPAELKLRAGYGGRFQTLLSSQLEVVAGEHVALEARAHYERRPRDRFYGIGNVDESQLSDLTMTNIDAATGNTAVETRFSEELVQAGLRAALKVPKPFGLALESFYLRRRFGEKEVTALGVAVDDLSVEEVYDTSTIPGFDDGVDFVYTELELSLDTRRASSPYASDPIPGTGWYLELYGGLAESVGDDSTSFFRYGVDIQRYVQLAQNPRTLVVRAHLEGVTDGLEDVPFTELPRLGGPVLLRGYRRDRLRDRIRALTTLEYQWDLSDSFAGFTFVDVGTVMRDYGDFDADKLRVGYGIGLQMHSRTSYIGRVELGSSIDGGLVANIVFDPAFDIQSRTLRK